MGAPHLLWPPAPENVVLAADEIHLWSWPLDLPASRIEALRRALSEEEGRRADRFRTGQLRNRFVAGRGTLRSVLARYLGLQPRQLQLTYEPLGKPVLATAVGPGRLHFNISHSHGLALLAVADGREVGVDLEQIRPMPNAARLVERFFSPQENRQWRRLPPEAQPTAFFQAWTRKEAWLKAIGSGLSFPLSQFCVSLLPGEQARVLSIRGDTAEAAQWWLDSCEPSPGYVAAVAVQGRPAAIRRWAVQQDE
jgi:4'-phosphopantetheinyl transferase